MTPEENRRRLNRLRAEEVTTPAKAPSKAERNYGPERRYRAQLNRQRMRATL